MVGASVRKGCGGRGGWLYQGMAILLTYCAIVVTYVPFVLKGIQEGQIQEQKQPEAPKPADPSPIQIAVALAVVFAIAFLAPFLAGFENILGLIIIGFALYEAWKLNKRRRFEFAGPFRLKEKPSGA